VLRHFVPDPTRRPPNQTREELHPQVGSRTLFSLTQDEEWVYFNEVNDRGSKITDTALADPPQVMHIHLCWGIGYPALTRLAGGVAAASLLQSLVGTLLDDWRQALTALLLEDGAESPGGLRPRFHLHRCWPAPRRNAYLGKAGPRWREQARVGPMPPLGFVGQLFERHDHVQLAGGGAAWQGDSVPGAFAWWCGCVLDVDLPGMGFERRERTRLGDGQALPEWTGPAARLSVPLRHLLVVDAPAGAGWVCRVERDGETCRVAALPSRHRIAALPGVFFAALRQAALGTLLGVLLDPLADPVGLEVPPPDAPATAPVGR
jgi:hypothetical protein